MPLGVEYLFPAGVGKFSMPYHKGVAMISFSCRRFLFLAFSLLLPVLVARAAEAAACPDLIGTYACKDFSGNPGRDYKIRQITEEQREGQTGYYLGDTDVVWASPEGTWNSDDVRAVCGEDSLTITFRDTNGGFYKYELADDDQLRISVGQTSNPEQIKRTSCHRK